MKIKDKILIVEDEQSISNFISMVLNANGYDTIIVGSGEEALTMIASHCPDLIVLDLGLPDMDGMEVLEELRTWSLMPVVVVSARTDEREKVRALDAGADDYITKPFNILELKARIKAILRRSVKKAPAETQEKKVLKARDLELSFDSRRVFISGKEVNLTAKEFDLLELLMENPGKVYSREKLLDTVWGYDYPGDVRTVDVHVRRLREKIEVNPSEPKYIFTKWGVGYYFQA